MSFNTESKEIIDVPIGDKFYNDILEVKQSSYCEKHLQYCKMICDLCNVKICKLCATTSKKEIEHYYEHFDSIRKIYVEQKEVQTININDFNETYLISKKYTDIIFSGLYDELSNIKDENKSNDNNKKLISLYNLNKTNNIEFKSNDKFSKLHSSISFSFNNFIKDLNKNIDKLLFNLSSNNLSDILKNRLMYSYRFVHHSNTQIDKDLINILEIIHKEDSIEKLLSYSFDIITDISQKNELLKDNNIANLIKFNIIKHLRKTYNSYNETNMIKRQELKDNNRNNTSNNIEVENYYKNEESKLVGLIKENHLNKFLDVTKINKILLENATLHNIVENINEFLTNKTFLYELKELNNPYFNFNVIQLQQHLSLEDFNLKLSKCFDYTIRNHVSNALSVYNCIVTRHFKEIIVECVIKIKINKLCVQDEDNELDFHRFWDFFFVFKHALAITERTFGY